MPIPNENSTYSLMYACPDHPDLKIPELEPRTFSFNSPHGACPVCTGLGSRMEVDPELVIPNGKLTIAEGAIRPYNRINVDNWYMKKLQAVADRYGFNLHVPTGELSAGKPQPHPVWHRHETYKIRLGAWAVVQQHLRGRHPEPGAPPQGNRQRLHPPRHRALHAGTALLHACKGCA
jgi:excinuclease UvrABC ATPase subunit